MNLVLIIASILQIFATQGFEAFDFGTFGTNATKATNRVIINHEAFPSDRMIYRLINDSRSSASSSTRANDGPLIGKLQTFQSISYDSFVNQTILGVRPFKNFIIGMYDLYYKFFSQLLSILPLQTVYVAFRDYFVDAFALFQNCYTELLKSDSPYVSGAIIAAIIVGVIKYPLRMLDLMIVGIIIIAGSAFLVSSPYIPFLYVIFLTIYFFIR
jgi:hypothetical protein